MKMIFITIPLCIAYITLNAQSTSTVRVDDSTFSAIRQLKEIIVTAEKRELTVSEIPMALSVITGKNLPHENNLDLRNLSGIIPNFYLQEGGLKLSTPLYVRGVGTVSGTPPVGLYVDGVPVFDKNAFIFDLYDIKQIEVSRGPQTTLYGRNSIIGLINITTNAPSSRWSLRASAGIASYNSLNYMFLANIPLAKIAYNKLSFSYNRTDGYFKNLYTKNKPNRSDSYHMRYQGRLHTHESWKVMIGANYNHSFDDGYAYHAIDSLKIHPYRVNYNSTSSYKRDLFSAYLNARKNFHRTSLHWITSYSRSKDKQELDADFTYHDVFQNLKESRQNLVTQEVNYQSERMNRLDWTVGFFGFYKDLENDYLALFGKDRRLLLPLDLDQSSYYNNTLTWGVAGYGQITVKELLPGLSITAGIRFDHETVELTYRDSLLYPGESRFTGYHDWAETRDFDAWLPKFSLMQKWNTALSTYFTIAKGYKAGGYNIISNEMSSLLVKLGYDREVLWNYELGTKYFSRNNHLNINAALFYIDWQDQQIFVMGMMGPSIKNAGDARSIGAEVDLNWEFLPRTTCFLAAGYNDSEYYRHLTAEYHGNRIVMAPEFTLNTGFSYYHPLRSRYLRTFTFSTSVTGFGKQYFDEANLLKQDPYFLWNLDLGITGKHLEFRVWGKNLLDRTFFSYMFNSPVGQNLPEYFNSGQSGTPSRFGVSLTLTL